MRATPPALYLARNPLWVALLFPSATSNFVGLGGLTPAGPSTIPRLSSRKKANPKPSTIEFSLLTNLARRYLFYWVSLVFIFCYRMGIEIFVFSLWALHSTRIIRCWVLKVSCCLYRCCGMMMLCGLYLIKGNVKLKCNVFSFSAFVCYLCDGSVRGQFGTVWFNICIFFYGSIAC